MAYEHPLAYLLGLEGIALLRGFTGQFDREFTEERIAEVRRLLDDESLIGTGVDVEHIDAREGYRVWSQTYDEQGNQAFTLEEPVVNEILDALPAGTVLDAACGTGRHSEYLAAAGHRVIGVDESPEMLARARERVPAADFRDGSLDALPLADDDFDLVVCSLALTHLSALGLAISEFARVLRPGGHLVISDLHYESVSMGSIHGVHGPDGQAQRVTTYRHLPGDYLRAALPLGFRVLRCEEPRLPDLPESVTASVELGQWQHWPWSLTTLTPEAARAANAGRPAMIVWHLQLADS